jgi:hypothetical protein
MPNVLKLVAFFGTDHVLQIEIENEMNAMI